MNINEVKLPELTGSIELDIVSLHTYCVQMQRILSFMLSNLNSKNFNVNLLPELFKNSSLKLDGAEIRCFKNGLWIGTARKKDTYFTPAKGDYGIFIKFNAAPQSVVDGNIQEDTQ